MDFNYGKLWTGIGPLNHASTLQVDKAPPPTVQPDVEAANSSAENRDKDNDVTKCGCDIGRGK
jgi:hypothetical protein